MRKNKTKGFTLIEVIFSIVLLGIISVFIIPMSIYSVKYAKWNNIRLNALNLAYTQVEWLKTLDYDDLGLDISGYSPRGIVKDDYYMNDNDSVTIKGVKYHVTTGVYWEGSESSTGEPVPQATKKVDVVVEAKDVFTGEIKEYSVLGTLISREGERIPTLPGQVKVSATLRGANEGVKNVMIGLGQSTLYSTFANTDGGGIALIGNLMNGAYKVQPIKWSYFEIMVMPNGVNAASSDWKLDKEVIVPKWDKNNKPKYPEINFYIDLPGYIALPVDNKYPKAAKVEIKPTGESYIPSEGESEEHMLLEVSIEELISIKFWRLWNYEYTIENGEDRYFFTRSETGYLWDGKFDIDDLNKATTEKLDIVFALDENSVYKKTNNKLTEIIINFTSQVNNIELMEFTLNDELIDKSYYTITQIISGKNNAFKITLDGSKNFTEDIINFEIINPDCLINSYGMRLSKDLNKCTLTPNN
ncbi:type II secretion system protein [Proteiniborus sp. MB09-C3]|uniref:type IV pilus modification PilV family protein n=1 Tax=Proteiniborus sp. MB09-C3 TaxID=3050072 RepID=UPI00255517EE|nr:type II secretion system protein [Proteiniborus sp. MB09-C3]WIV11018.1 type II secretion system protein [Proteiniborus sp. MB09-C3]